MLDSEFERLEDLAITYFGSLGGLSRALGKAQSFLYTYKGKSKIGRNLLNELKEKTSINPDYILYGFEPKFLPNNNIESSGNITPNVLVDNQSDSQDSNSNIIVEEKNIEDELQDTNCKVFDLHVNKHFNINFNFDNLSFSYIPLNIGQNLDNFKIFRIIGNSFEKYCITQNSLVFIDVCLSLDSISNDDELMIINNGVVEIKLFSECKDLLLMDSLLLKPVIKRIGVLKAVLQYR